MSLYFDFLIILVMELILELSKLDFQLEQIYLLLKLILHQLIVHHLIKHHLIVYHLIKLHLIKLHLHYLS